jgi:hypothetical protein
VHTRAWLLCFGLLGCANDECTEIGCDNTSEVTYPVGLVSAPYDLTIVAEVGTITARCLDPTAPEAEMNPPELKCDREGFTITGGDFAQMQELMVTVVDVETEEVLATGNVDANAVDEITPNGPDCPGVCYVRNGALVGEPPG